MTLRFYTREGCCICEQAEERLRIAGIAFEKISIKGDAEKIAKYGHSVPVVAWATSTTDELIFHEGPLGLAELRRLQFLMLRRAKAAKRAILKP